MSSGVSGKQMFIGMTKRKLISAGMLCLVLAVPQRVWSDDDGFKIWQAKPAPAGAEPVAHSDLHVVDYGDEFVWRQAGHVGYRGWCNLEGKRIYQGGTVIRGMDVDGDGKSENDCIAYFEFSLDKPFNPVDPGWDMEGSGAVFYGGITGYFPDNNGKSGLTESGCNVMESDGDNINIMSNGTKERHRIYGIWLWKKEDFFNGGDRHRVSTDDKSRIGLHVMRYFDDIDNARFVIQDEGQFFISEFNFGTPEYLQKFKDGGDGGYHYHIRVHETRWAEYNPKGPYHIGFDPDQVVFAERTFKDIQSAGYFVGKHKWDIGGLDVKLYAFDLYATVHRPIRHSENLAMAEMSGIRCQVSGGKAEVPPFYISKCEIPYELYHKIRRWGVSFMYGFEEDYPYMEDRDGDMGSMDFPGPDGKLLSHGPDEPATDMTWLDAIAWCNMLSEYEGKTPCYYLTPNFDTVFRRAREWRMGHRNKMYVPKVYVKWDADGYRLPTPQEWAAAAGKTASGSASANQRRQGYVGQEATADRKRQAENRTHPVGAGEANENGLYDMLGNVWEYTWDQGEAMTSFAYNRNPSFRPPAEGPPHTVLGGDFNTEVREPAFAEATAGKQKSEVRTADIKGASPYGDVPYTGNYNIGFRVVRRESGLPKPDTRNLPALRSPQGGVGKPETGIPQWLFTHADKTPGKTLERLEKPLFETVEIPESSYVREDTAKIFVSPFFMGRTEVTYAQWKRVYDWAIAAGYKFANDGDMGSMDRECGKHVHSPDEPVTDFSRFDAVIFCNALSEMEGRRPCYYDRELVNLYKTANQYRRAWIRTPEKYNEPQFGEMNKAFMIRLDKGYEGVYTDWSADGYRIPTHAEWIVACLAGTKTTYFWGDEYADGLDTMVCRENSDGKTWPVASRKPNPYGLHDMLGNAWEYCWGHKSTLGQGLHETWNPKGIPVNWVKGMGSCQLMQGGSFRYGAWHDGAYTVTRPGRSYNYPYKSYPEIGLRVVRCEARTHWSTGKEMPDSIQVLDVNLQEAVTPLQGQTHRGNLQRTGVLYTKGVPKLTGVKWQFKTGGAIPCQPLVHRGVVYACSADTFVYALDAETGEEKWRYKIAGGPALQYDVVKPKPAAPTLKDGILYLGSNSGHVYALDIRTGRPKWATTFRGAVIATGSPVPVYGAVFANVLGYTKDCGIMAIHGETGQLLTLYRNPLWGCWSTWAFAEGKLVMANHFQISALDLKSGDRKTMGVSPSGTNHNIPIIKGGRIHAVGRFVMCVDYRSWTKTYAKELEAASENASALWNDIIFFGDNRGHLNAHDALNGKKLWQVKLGERIRSAPTVSTETPDAQDAIVYVGSDDGMLWALDAADGKKLWQFKTSDDKIRSDAWIEDGVVFFGSDNGILYAVH